MTIAQSRGMIPFELNRVHQGDALELLKRLPDGCVDAVVTDPPYGLKFMGKHWDCSVPKSELWAEVLRVMKPGAHLVAFFGTRTYHRGVVAIEDAGFEIRDQLAWVYGSGFPKSLDVSKAIYKAAGAERKVLGTKDGGPDMRGNNYSRDNGERAISAITAPATDAARQWQGWGTALKPAWEPICLARKPLGNPAIDILQAVEYIMKKNGLEDIRWIKSSAKRAAKKNQSESFTQIRPPISAEETFVERASESEMQGIEIETEKKSGNQEDDSMPKTRSARSNTESENAINYDQKFSRPMAGSAPVAEKQSTSSSPLTISTEAVVNTEKQSAHTSIETSVSADSPLDSASFAGTAIALLDVTDTALTIRAVGREWIIEHTADGFVWPDGLPKALPAQQMTVAENVLANGTGAINVDGCRVGDDTLPAMTAGQAKIGTFERGVMITPERTGRWPANLVHDGSEEVLECFPDAPGAQFGVGPKYGDRDTVNAYGNYGPRPSMTPRGDAGSAARFFYSAKADAEDRGPGNDHPTVKPTDLMRWLTRLVTPPGGLILDPFAGSGSTGVAAIQQGFRFLGFDLDEHNCRDIAAQRLEAAVRGQTVEQYRSGQGVLFDRGRG